MYYFFLDYQVKFTFFRYAYSKKFILLVIVIRRKNIV
jgi:hypothetical protein